MKLTTHLVETADTATRARNSVFKIPKGYLATEQSLTIL